MFKSCHPDHHTYLYTVAFWAGGFFVFDGNVGGCARTSTKAPVYGCIRTIMQLIDSIR